MRFMTRGKKPAGRAAKAPSTRRRGGTENARNRRIDAARKRLGVKYGLIGLAALILGGGGYLGWQNDLHGHALDWAGSRILDGTVHIGLSVEEVYVVGRKETAREDVLSALNVTVGDPILGFDPTEARDRLEALGWIKSAEVRRTLPGTVVVKIEERRAIAIWQHDDSFVLIDPDGVVIGAKDLKRHSHLKLLVGPDAPMHAQELLTVLAQEPELENRVVAAIRVGARRWNLRLDGGIDVHMPETGVAEAWRQLATYQRDHEILSRTVQEIDMRQIDRMTLQLTEPGLQEVMMRGKGEET